MYLLLLLLTGAGLAAAGPLPELLSSQVEGSEHLARQLQQAIAAVAALALAVGLWLTATLRNTKKAEAWYDGRALAESTKSMAWKYMMKAEPYGADLSSRQADELFCNDLEKLLSEAGSHALPGASAAGAQITDAMVAVRSLDPPVRLATYLRSRVEDQRDWYSRRSGDHAKSSRRWFRVTIAVNVMALLLAVTAVVWFPVSGAVGVATTAASCCVAWMQLQRYAELAHSYSFTSHEIGLLAPRASGIQSDDDLARFVSDCETAFSREHTMWRARREIANG